MPRGGYRQHKPDCPCPACTYRRRQEAISAGDGAGGQALEPSARTESKPAEVINAEEPFVVRSLVAHKERIADWLRLRFQEPDITIAEAARKLGIPRSTLKSSIYKAAKEGWLKFDDPLARIENVIIPRTLDNIEYFLEKKDKSVTIEAFKHTIAKDYQEAQGINKPATTVLALKIETVPTVGTAEMSGIIVGKAREIAPAEEEEKKDALG